MTEAATSLKETIKRSILPLLRMYPCRFWRIPGEKKNKAFNHLNNQRVLQEKTVLEQWLNGMDTDVRRMVLCRLEDAETNESLLNMVLAAKISCARKLLENKLPVAASILMEQVTGWHVAKEKPLPLPILQIAYLTAKVHSEENDLPQTAN